MAIATAIPNAEATAPIASPPIGTEAREDRRVDAHHPAAQLSGTAVWIVVLPVAAMRIEPKPTRSISDERDRHRRASTASAIDATPG